MFFSLLFYIVVLAILALFAWFFFVLIRIFLTTIMNKQNRPATFYFNGMSESLTLRSIIIGVLALLMLVPLGLVNETVDERGFRYNSVLNDIASTWGQPQTLSAAIVVVPYVESVQTEETITDANGEQRIVDKVRLVTHNAYFLPDTLKIDVNIADEMRQRGIFKSLVYNADVMVQADFESFDVNSLSDNISTIHWNKAWLTIGLSDTRAINSVKSFKWQNIDKALSPGTRINEIASGFHAELNLNEIDFSHKGAKKLELSMNVKGSGTFQFTPFGETTNVSISSTWPHPSFSGSALPNDHRIDNDGFDATWTIPHLARNYQQRWSNSQEHVNLLEFTAGVSMFEPVSLYSQVTRAVKYGLLFIGLTFLTLFIFEMAIDRKLHIVQYALIGVALSLFFLVLLSLSEHTAFIAAYASAAMLTISMISCYVWMALRSFIRASMVFLMLTGLYAILYSLLQFEDFALLVGTGLLVFVVMVLMFLTRNIQQQAKQDNAVSVTADETG